MRYVPKFPKLTGTKRLQISEYLNDQNNSIQNEALIDNNTYTK